MQIITQIKVTASAQRHGSRSMQGEMSNLKTILIICQWQCIKSTFAL